MQFCKFGRQIEVSQLAEFSIDDLALVDLAIVVARASLVSDILSQYPDTPLVIVHHVANAIESIKDQLNKQKLEEELLQTKQELSQTKQELSQTKEKLNVRSAVAWMAMNTAHWRHTIQGHAINIVDEVELLRRQFRRQTKKRAYRTKTGKNGEISQGYPE